MITLRGQTRITPWTLLIGVVGGVVGYLLQNMYVTFAVPFIEKIVPSLSQESLLVLIVILLFLLMVSSVALFFFWRKSKTSIDLFVYARDPLIGISQHKATGEYFCTSCLINRILSPVREDETGWICLRKGCEQKYLNPQSRSAKHAGNSQ
jgi:hypothetical protein